MSYPSWHAVEKIDDAVDDTKDFLLPFKLGTWARMAVIVILTGGFISGLPAPGSDFGGQDFNKTAFEQDIDALSDENSRIDVQDNLALAIFGLIGGAIMVFSYISSVFTFIFFRSVDTKEPELIKGFRIHWFDGFKYMLYKGIMIAAWATTLLVPLIAVAMENLLAVLASIVLMNPVWIALYIFSFSVGNYTVPRMSTEASGFIKSTLEGLQSFRQEWKQAGVFILVKIALGIVVAAVTGIVNFAALLFIGIPVGIMTFFAYAVNPLFAVLPILVGVLCLSLVSITAAIPLRTYMVQWVLSTYSEFE